MLEILIKIDKELKRVYIRDIEYDYEKDTEIGEILQEYYNEYIKGV